MQRRVIAVFLAFCFACGMLCVRVYILTGANAAAGYTESHNKKITLDTLRLPVYDCNSQPLVNCSYQLFAAAKPDLRALEKLKYKTSAEEYGVLETKIREGEPFYCRLSEPVEPDGSVVCLKKYVRYSPQQTAVHLTGYINSDGNGVSGIEKAFDGFLKTDIELYASFACDARGRIISGEPIKTNPLYNNSRGGVYLTADKKIQQIVEEEIRASSIKKGAALVCETKTGKIKAMVSVPDFSPENVSAYLDDKDSPLVNRAVSAYPVGSVFKIAVAAAALECGISENFTYDCKGSCEVDGVVYKCSNSTAHGRVDMRKALVCSCNGYFIALAKKAGGKAVLEMAKRLGFGERIMYAENMYSSSGKVPDIESLSSSGSLANFSFGQGEFTANALQAANMFNCIGNGGEYTNPYAVAEAFSAQGEKVYEFVPKPPVKAVERSAALKIRDMLKDVIAQGTAKNAKTEGFTCAGKTATAQTGIFNSDGTEKLCTWFGGFFPAENPQYTVVIIKEDGTTGGSDCAPVFRAIAQRIYGID